MEIVCIPHWKKLRQNFLKWRREQKFVHLCRFKFRDFFPRLFKYSRAKKAKKGRRERIFENSFSISAFFSILLWVNFFFVNFFFFFPDGAEIYIKQAPLVIINERMNYCEFNFFFSFHALSLFLRFPKEFFFNFPKKNVSRLLERLLIISSFSIVSVKWLIVLSIFPIGQLQFSPLVTRYFCEWKHCYLVNSKER